MDFLPPPRKTPFAAWSFANWTEAGRADTLALAEKRWTDALALIKVTKVPSSTGPSEAVIAQVTDPDALVFAVLQEAVMLQQRLKKAETLLGTLPAGHARKGTSLSSGVAYLLYNAGTDQTRAVVLSALVHGYKQNGSALKKAVAADTALEAIVSPLVSTMAGMDKAAVIAAAGSDWPTLSAWMSKPGNLELLSTFIETTGPGAWPSWQEPRGNVSRYRVLEDYYLGL